MAALRRQGRTVDEWKQHPNHPENHWLDCAVGCAVAASMQGVALEGMQRHRALVERKEVTLAELAARAKSPGGGDEYWRSYSR